MMIDVGAGVAFLVFASTTGVMAATAGRMQRQSRRPAAMAVRVPGPSVRVLRGSEQLREARERVGRPAVDGDVPSTGPGPTVEELDRAFADHGINVGPPMEQQEADDLLVRLAVGA